MKSQMRDLMHDPDLRETLTVNGYEAIAARHTCSHRARQLLDIYGSLTAMPAREAA